MENLSAILNKKIVAYKRTENELALKLEDGTLLSVKEEHKHDESWIEVIVTAPDDDQWVSITSV